MRAKEDDPPRLKGSGDRIAVAFDVLHGNHASSKPLHRRIINPILGTAAPRRVGASLLSPAETSLATVTQIEFADQLTVAATTAAHKADRSLWWLLAACGFAVLLLEWWWFQRRPGGA